MGIRLSRCDLQHICISRYLFEDTVKDAELIEALENHRQLLLILEKEKRQAITILDCADSYVMPARQRHIQGEWNRAVEDLEHVTTLGKCFVLRSVMARGILTAITWFAPPRVLPRVFASTNEALVWAFEVCEAAGVAVSEAQRRDCSARLVVR